MPKKKLPKKVKFQKLLKVKVVRWKLKNAISGARKIKKQRAEKRKNVVDQLQAAVPAAAAVALHPAAATAAVVAAAVAALAPAAAVARTLKKNP